MDCWWKRLASFQLFWCCCFCCFLLLFLFCFYAQSTSTVILERNQREVCMLMNSVAYLAVYRKSGEVDTTEWWNGWFVWPNYRKIKGKLSGGNWCWDICTRSSLVKTLSCLTLVLRHIYRTVAGAVDKLSDVSVETHIGLSLTQSISCLASMLRDIIIRNCRWWNRWVVWRQCWDV